MEKAIKKTELQRLKTERDHLLDEWARSDGERKTQLLIRIMDIDYSISQKARCNLM